MVKFGAYLKGQYEPTYPVDAYLCYDELKAIIKSLTNRHLTEVSSFVCWIHVGAKHFCVALLFFFFACCALQLALPACSE